MFVDTVRLALVHGQMLLHAAKLPYLISRRPSSPSTCSIHHAGLSSSLMPCYCCVCSPCYCCVCSQKTLDIFYAKSPATLLHCSMLHNLT